MKMDILIKLKSGKDWMMPGFLNIMATTKIISIYYLNPKLDYTKFAFEDIMSFEIYDPNEPPKSKGDE